MRSFLIFFCLMAVSLIYGNNITVSNVSLTDQNAAANTTQVQFDLSWENSWRVSFGPSNYDAAWVFVKYRVNGNDWEHATISDDGSVAPAGASLNPTDNVGAFIYRSADGSGDNDFRDIQLRWDYTSTGVDANSVVDVQVFAVEMVYVPGGQFSMGTTLADGDNMNGEFYSLASVFAIPQAYTVSSEAAIPVSNTAGNLYYDNTEGLGEAGIGDQLGPIPAPFPKGFTAFYCMKYEVTQAQ